MSEHLHIDGACVFICRSEWEYRRRVRDCPVCKRRRRFVQAIPDSPYYGAIWTCCGCGDSWCDGELMERPFRPRWRQDATADAKKKWSAAA